MTDVTVARGDWTDGDLTLDLELKLMVNFQEKGRLYFQVFLKGDKEGKCDIAPYLEKGDRDHIETCIKDALGEMDNGS